MHFRTIVVKVANHNSTRMIGLAIAGYAAAWAVYGFGSQHGLQGVKIVLTTAGLVLGVMVASRVAGTRIGDMFNFIGKNTLPVYLMFDMMIAVVVYGLLQIPNLALVPGIMYITPLLVVPTVVLLTLATHRLLIAARQNWLFELHPALRGTAK
jgi:uncharacterized membrane protein YcfT